MESFQSGSARRWETWHKSPVADVLSLDALGPWIKQIKWIG